MGDHYKFKSKLTIWLYGFILLSIFNLKVDYEFYLYPFAVAMGIYWMTKGWASNNYVKYILFFSISITSVFGLTKVLTGSHAENKFVFLYGLSFYTVSMAYLMHKYKKIDVADVVQATNPMLLATGPVATKLRSIKYKKLNLRVEYYLPYILVGVFFYYIVGKPLQSYFALLYKTDVLSSLMFAIIFEIFVYANFCGLSLIVYGVFGLAGYEIPLNFKQPFSSSNVIEFWRGWHSSLSTVLKALFFIPLKKYSVEIALYGVYLASALWHGVSLNFIIWGVFHATIFVITIRLLKNGYLIFANILLPFAIILGRLIFAENDTERLFEKLKFSYQGFGALSQVLIAAPNASKAALIMGGLLVGAEYCLKNNKLFLSKNYKYLRTPWSLLILTLVFVLLYFDQGIGYAVYGQR